MELISTKNAEHIVGLEEALFQGLAPDKGLYIPKKIPVIIDEFWKNSDRLSFIEIAFEICKTLFQGELNDSELIDVLNNSITFDAPLVEIKPDVFCLELFHGPSMAFKDFGARFMAALMSHYLQKKERNINILVATSGDTGGAVAEGFLGTPNIKVHILYPSGKVSDIQEKQLTSLGQNICAYEVKGTFDDCQRIVKSAFVDMDLKSQFHLASANSINIARLIPQSFYYAYAYSRLKNTATDIVFSVPSGNLGNLSAGVIAQKMGMPNCTFVAATNSNNEVPNYLRDGVYAPIVPSKSTISNAMDVGDPSNFPRLQAFYDNDLETIQKNVKGYSYSDDQTREAIKEVDKNYGYIMCPHTAIAYLGQKDYGNDNTTNVFLSTAHYAKFLEIVEPVLRRELPIPNRLKMLLDRKKVAELISSDYVDFKNHFYKNSI